MMLYLAKAMASASFLCMVFSSFRAQRPLDHEGIVLDMVGRRPSYLV
jgi:hypothetical protein